MAGTPEISEISNQSTNQNTPVSSIAFHITDTGSAPCSLNLTITSSNTTLIPNENISYTCNNNQYTLTVTPASNQSGTATINIIAEDNANLTSSISFEINVNALPEIASVDDQDTIIDLPTSIAFQVTDTEGGDLPLQVMQTNFTLIPFGNISITGDNVTTDGTNYTLSTFPGTPETISLTITPASGLTGTSNINIQVTDNGTTVQKSFGYNVLPVYTVDESISLSGVSYSAIDFGDYDRDGDLDILITGDSNSGKIASVYQNTAGMFYALTGINLDGVSNSACKFFDHDNDGDLDILLSGNAGANKIAKIYENNGSSFVEDTNIVFTGSEYGTADFADYDNDGDFDIFDGDLDILLAGDTGSGKIAAIYDNTACIFSENIDISLKNSFYGHSIFGDYDNDGDLDIFHTGKDSSYLTFTTIYRNNINTPNSLPSEPTGLSAVVQGQNIQLYWNAASDDETPSTGLNYNLSIGSSPGSSDISAPMALPLSNGYRQIVSKGAFQGLTSTISLSQTGTYYWRVQAIDTAFAGSSFSSEYSFTISDLAPIAGNSGVITYDPLSLDNSNTIHWELASDAITLTSSLEYRMYTSSINFGSNGNVWENQATAISNWVANTITGNLPGLNTISNYYVVVLVRDETGNISIYQPLAIEAFTEITSFNFPDVDSGTIDFLDFDNDADLDILITGTGDGTKIAKIYHNINSNYSEYTSISLSGVSSSASAIGDYDNDGDLDIILTGVDSNSNYTSTMYQNTGGNYTEYTNLLRKSPPFQRHFSQ